MLQGAAQVLLSMAPTTSEVSMIFIEVLFLPSTHDCAGKQ